MRQRQDKSAEILIVGAGPAGLMMACQLAHLHIPFRIIDKKDRKTNYSGALIIQARSIEILHQLGIAQKAIHNGIIAGKIIIRFNGGKAFEIPVKNIGQGLTEFPYFLMVEQTKTEQLLIDFISNFGYAVEWETELFHFSQDKEGVTASLRLSDGYGESLKVKYMIAADGGHSAVREQLTIPFLGTTHPVSLFVTDCNAEVNLPPDTICFSFSDLATAGFFPLINGRWRVDGSIPGNMEAKVKLTFNEIADNFAERTRMRVRLYKSRWFSVFHSHQGYASTFHQNRCFLIGDAAHIHSPVGAQGMNTGLQDACNLAWKLALVIQRNAKESLLDTYTAERASIAKKVLRSTERIFKLVTSQHFIIKSFRVYIVPVLLRIVFPLIAKQKAIRHFFFSNISEIGMHYRKSPLSQHASFGKFPPQAPKPGDRLPYIRYYDNGTKVNIQEKVKVTGFCLFVFDRKKLPDDIIAATVKYASFISVETFTYTAETSDLYERFGIKSNGCYLIRPDMYIAYRSTKQDVKHLKSYLQHYFAEA